MVAVAVVVVWGRVWLGVVVGVGVVGGAVVALVFEVGIVVVGAVWVAVAVEIGKMIYYTGK